MKTIAPVLAGIVLAAVSVSLQAALLTIQPPTKSVAVGVTFEVAVTVSGLGVGAAPSLSVFDLDLTYDAGLLQFDSLTFGDPVLGDQLDLSTPAQGTLTASGSPVPGVVNHFELSFDAPATLDSLQPDAFTLSVFRFTALSAGVSPLDLVVNSFGDSPGAPLDATVQGGSVTVTVVPEPTLTGLVFALGPATWVVLRRRKARR